jgi:hypothetical protein
MFTLFVCVINLNAQVVDTLSYKVVKKEAGLSVEEEAGLSVEEVIWKEKAILEADNIYTSSIYFDKGGTNLMWGGITLGLSMVVGMIPLTELMNNPRKEVYYGFLGTSGGLFIISVIQFIVGGNQISKGGMILRQKKNYIIETNGTNLKIKF